MMMGSWTVQVLAGKLCNLSSIPALPACSMCSWIFIHVLTYKIKAADCWLYSSN